LQLLVGELHIVVVVDVQLVEVLGVGQLVVAEELYQIQELPVLEVPVELGQLELGPLELQRLVQELPRLVGELQKQVVVQVEVSLTLVEVRNQVEVRWYREIDHFDICIAVLDMVHCMNHHDCM
jgi:hypothetical protein